MEWKNDLLIKLDGFDQILEVVYVLKTLTDMGREDLIESNLADACYTGHYDRYFQAAYFACIEALCSLTKSTWCHYSEKTELEVFYFSHPDMMEYYHLCREYGRKKGVKLSDNPYMKEARQYVRSRLEKGCYSCYYHLHTGINHDCASGIAFYTYPEFEGYMALLVEMNCVLSFYSEKLCELKREMNSQNDTLKEAA